MQLSLIHIEQIELQHPLLSSSSNCIEPKPPRAWARKTPLTRNFITVANPLLISSIHTKRNLIDQRSIIRVSILLSLKLLGVSESAMETFDDHVYETSATNVHPVSQTHSRVSFASLPHVEALGATPPSSL